MKVTHRCLKAVVPWTIPRLVQLGAQLGMISRRKVFSIDASSSGLASSVALLPQVIRQVKETKCSLLLITPLWRNQVWFLEMIQLLSVAPWLIPLRKDLISPVQFMIWHPQLELWILHVLDGSQASF